MDSVAETHQALSHDDYVDRHDTTLSEQQVQSVNEQLKKQQHEHIIHAPQYSDADDGELLVCQWVECGERYGNAEDLYNHVCDVHVGRKSTNNLNLVCHWGNCTTITVKRDHITSHIRVHIPLKPHKCDSCGKTFKRPQDLKKHVKTHAEESGLAGSSDLNMVDQQGGQPDDGRGYYAGHDVNGYGQNGNYYGPPYNGYGQQNYNNMSLADQQSMDTRRRAIEALNDFLGDVKRRALDPTNYYDVGQRLNTQALPLPVSIGSGYSLGGGYNVSRTPQANYSSIDNSGYMAQSGGNAMGQTYALPIANARTKADLVDIDRFLEQLQTTIYDQSSSNQFNPTAHSQAHSSGHYSRHTPPQAQNAGLTPINAAPMANMTSQGTDTPALTPASLSSYASSGHSPPSSNTHSRASTDSTSMYPQLPSVAGLSSVGSSYSATPVSGLASGFDGFDARRYSGGRLQRQAPQSNEEVEMSLDSPEAEGQRTPKQGSAVNQANVDPALRDEESMETEVPTEGALSEDDEAQARAAFEENVRSIEHLRNWVRERLEAGDFVRDASATPEAALERALKVEAEASRFEAEQQLKQEEAEHLQQSARRSPEHEIPQSSAVDETRHTYPEISDETNKQEYPRLIQDLQTQAAESEHVDLDQQIAYPTLKPEE